MVDEIGERSGIAVLLPHEQQGNTRSEQNECCRQLRLRQGDQGHQPVTFRTIADMVVVLGKNYEALGRDVKRGCTLVALPEA